VCPRVGFVERMSEVNKPMNRAELVAWKASIERTLKNYRALEEEAIVKFIAYDKDRNGTLDFNEIHAVCVTEFANY